MKKIFFLLNLAIIINSSFAQTNYGIKAGINLSHLKLRDYQNSSSSYKPGINVGAFGQIHLSRKLFLQPELQYDQIRSSSDSSSTTLNYLSIPITLKFKTIGGFSIYAGPQLGILLNVNIKDKKNNTSADVTKLFSDLIASGIVGIGIDLPANFSLSARYQFNIGSITSTNVPDPIRLPEISLGAFNIGVAYTFKK